MTFKITVVIFVLLKPQQGTCCGTAMGKNSVLKIPVHGDPLSHSFVSCQELEKMLNILVSSNEIPY